MTIASNPFPAPSVNQALLAKDEAHRSGLFSPDVVFVRGEGAYLWDADGNRYLDALAGIAVASLGHANERLAEAIAHQARRLIVAGQALGSDVRVAFLDALFAHMPAPLERAFLVNSGSEAVESAIKWAFAATGRRRVVAAKRGFSGRTLGALSMTWEPKYRAPFEPLPVPVDFVSYGDLAELEAAVGPETAMIWLEPVQGEGGVHVASPEYLHKARELADRHGALLGFDEIQTGVARSGRFLASAHAGVAPDLLTLAKGLAGGVPIGALIMSDAVAKAMPLGGHGSTFGGNPLACAAGLAVLDVLEQNDLPTRAENLGTRMLLGLAEALNGNPHVVDVRGKGLMIGIELDRPCGELVKRALEQGLLINVTAERVVRLLPPLILSDAEADQIVQQVSHLIQAFLQENAA